jgi:hypothetical protein
MKCSAEVAPVRAGPFKESEQVTQALRGGPLSAEERLVGWVRVRTAYGYEGWVSELALEEGQGHFADPVVQSPLDVVRTYLGAPYVWGGLSAEGSTAQGSSTSHIALRAGSSRATRGTRSERRSRSRRPKLFQAI